MRDPTDTWRDKQFKLMARLGWIACALSEATATYMPFASRCDSWFGASEKTVAARDEWLAKQRSTTA
jgi:hypothetical protein